MNKGEIKKKIKEILEKKEEIIFAYFYGSFLENEKYNDIDVGIFVDESKVKDFFDYETNLFVELWNKIKKEVDVRVINNAPLGFIFNVINGELIFTKDEEFLEEFIEKVGMEYSEFAYLNKMYLKELFE